MLSKKNIQSIFVLRPLGLILFSSIFFSAKAQYYLRGEVLDEKHKPIFNVKILSYTNKLFYYTGSSGAFGFNLNISKDSLILSLDGYETLAIMVDATKWQTIILKQESSNKNQVQRKMISYYDDYAWEEETTENFTDETYLKLVENPWVQTNQYPKSTITLNINKASYSNIRRFLNNDMKVPADAIRMEEMINYYNLQYTEPGGDSMFKIHSAFTECPWDNRKKLLYLTLSARKIDMSKVPPGNFVFLIDVSGSMDLPNRLPLIKSAFRLFVNHLRPIDTVSIVTYGGDAMVWLSPTSGNHKSKIMDAIESLEASGDTPGESAIKLAYKMARSTFIKGGNNRVILATDGDFNVGSSSEEALQQLIIREKSANIYLTCMGVGAGNLKDSKLQVLAKKGNGNYVYLDNIREAEKVFMNELTQTICMVADNATANIQFNPKYIKSYRLIGFDNEREGIDTKDMKLEGGQIGSASSSNLLYEIEPENYLNTDNSNIGTLSVSFQESGDSLKKNILFPIENKQIAENNLHPDYRFMNTITMFGLKLRKSRYSSTTDWKFIMNYYQKSGVSKNYFTDEFGKMIIKASKIYADKKKRKRFFFF